MRFLFKLERFARRRPWVKKKTVIFDEKTNNQRRPSAGYGRVGDDETNIDVRWGRVRPRLAAQPRSAGGIGRPTRRIAKISSVRAMRTDGRGTSGFSNAVSDRTVTFT